MNDDSVPEKFKHLIIENAGKPYPSWRINFDTSPLKKYVFFLMRYYVNGKPCQLAGGSLHIAYDDGNTEHGSIVYCHQFALRDGDWLGSLIALIFYNEYNEDELWEFYENDFGVEDKNGREISYKPMSNFLRILPQLIKYYQIFTENKLPFNADKLWEDLERYWDNHDWLGLLILESVVNLPDWVVQSLVSAVKEETAE